MLEEYDTILYTLSAYNFLTNRNDSMNIYKQLIKYTLTITFICQLPLSSSVWAASFGVLGEDNLYDIGKARGAQGEMENTFSGFEDTFKSGPVRTNAEENYLLVLNFIKQGQLNKAREKMVVLLKQNPNDAQLYNLQALLEIQEKNTDAAKQNYQKAIKIDQNNVDAYLNLAKIVLSEGQLSQSKNYVNKALTIDKQPIFAYFLLAEIALKQNDNKEVEKVLLAALKTVQGDLEAEAKVITNLGKFYVGQMQPQKILSLSREFVRRHPNESQALSALASAQFANNDKSSAEKTLRQIISQYTQDIRYRLVLAKLLGEYLNKEKEVSNLLDEIFQIEPDNLQALIFKTTYLIKTKQYKEAMALADKVDTLVPNLAIGKQLKGSVYIAERKLAKAQDAYQQAYQIEPNNKTLSDIVDLMSAQGKQAAAIGFLNNKLEKDGKNIAAHFKLATIYQQQKNNVLAEKHYDVILTEQPDNVNALNNLAWLYLAKNDSRAISIAEKAYKNASGAAAIADTYGYILVKQGKPKEGLAILEKAAKSLPNIKDIQYHLAEAYSENGNKGRAIEILERIVNIQETYSEKEAAIRLVKKIRVE
jgi:putative PEP-CTERM system TPR-repeat lipoprotein